MPKIDEKIVRTIAKKVEEKYGVVFLQEEIDSTVEMTLWKIKVKGKKDGYFLFLFENELEDLLMRQYINMLCSINTRARSESVPMTGKLAFV